uniref:Uncharacterized protein n=1 Tax=Knipowitschia caucasica TaxID=637954 RepID=A0AAV2LE87_KNICA
MRLVVKLRCILLEGNKNSSCKRLEEISSRSRIGNNPSIAWRLNSQQLQGNNLEERGCEKMSLPQQARRRGHWVVPLREPENCCFTAPHRDCFTAPHRDRFTAPHRDCFTAPHRDCFTDPHRDCFTAPHRDCFTAPHRDCFTDPEEVGWEAQKVGRLIVLCLSRLPEGGQPSGVSGVLTVVSHVLVPYVHVAVTRGVFFPLLPVSDNSGTRTLWKSISMLSDAAP